MLISIALIILGVVIAIKNTRYEGGAGQVFAAGVSAAWGMLIGLGIAAIIGCSVPATWEEIETTPIVSLKTEQEVQGSVFIVATNEYYYYMTLEGPNTYSRGSVRSDSAVIVEQNRVDGLLITEQRKAPSPQWYFLKTEPIRYEFLVPKGTVIQKFEVW